MSIRRKILNHYKRWNIQVDEQKAFGKFKNRVLNCVGLILKEPYRSKCAPYFADLYGSRYELNSIETTLRELNNSFATSCIGQAIAQAENLPELATALQFMFMTLEQNGPHLLGPIAASIQTAIDISPFIDLKIVKQGNSVIFYPSGAKLMDEGVVNDVLEWLEGYPKVSKHFQQALEIYWKKDKSKYRNLLDNLRLAIELLLKDVLNNKKPLEKQKEDLLKWLAGKGIHKQIINSYEKLLFGTYVQYQNDAVKHNEAFSEDEVEFIIYLTGTFMRLVLQLA
ncbi:MAG TPA: hypothetical protein V6D10_07205 [Trichocoleus sp.]|jgi:hypothetical protein